MKKTPVAIFVFNRPLHVRLALTSLQNCDGLENCDVYIFCDGPKTPDQIFCVDKTREVVKNFAPLLSAKVIERENNYGLAKSIVTGVTELCQEYGQVIVIEDDLVVSPAFIAFMLKGLERYKNASQVFQISGDMYPVIHPVQTDSFFLPYTTTHGWATWDRAWRYFDWNATGALEKLSQPIRRKQFDLDGSYPGYAAMLEARLAGKNQSWGILWWWQVFNAGGLVLHPRQSLVWIGGYDETGTHCKTRVFESSSKEEICNNRLSREMSFPSEIKIDEVAYIRIKDFLTSRRIQQKIDMLPIRIVKKIKRILQR